LSPAPHSVPTGIQSSVCDADWPRAAAVVKNPRRQCRHGMRSRLAVEPSPLPRRSKSKPLHERDSSGWGYHPRLKKIARRPVTIGHGGTARDLGICSQAQALQSSARSLGRHCRRGGGCQETAAHGDFVAVGNQRKRRDRAAQSPRKAAHVLAWSGGRCGLPEDDRPFWKFPPAKTARRWGAWQGPKCCRNAKISRPGLSRFQSAEW